MVWFGISLNKLGQLGHQERVLVLYLVCVLATSTYWLSDGRNWEMV